MIEASFTTESLPPEDRFACWHELASRVVVPTHVRCDDEAGFRATSLTRGSHTLQGTTSTVRSFHAELAVLHVDLDHLRERRHLQVVGHDGADRVALAVVGLLAEQDEVGALLLERLGARPLVWETSPYGDYNVPRHTPSFLVQPHLIELVQDRNGEVIWRADRRECPRCGTQATSTNVLHNRHAGRSPKGMGQMRSRDPARCGDSVERERLG